MSHTARLIGRPSLKTVKQLGPSYKNVQHFSPVYQQPIRRFAIAFKARKSPQLASNLRPKPFPQGLRYCSYNRNISIAKDDVTGTSMDASNGREVLPANVKPLHYDLTLEPNFEKFTYEGKVVIEYVEPDFQPQPCNMTNVNPLLSNDPLTINLAVSKSKKIQNLYPSTASKSTSIPQAYRPAAARSHHRPKSHIMRTLKPRQSISTSLFLRVPKLRLHRPLLASSMTRWPASTGRHTSRMARQSIWLQHRWSQQMPGARFPALTSQH